MREGMHGCWLALTHNDQTLSALCHEISDCGIQPVGGNAGAGFHGHAKAQACRQSARYVFHLACRQCQATIGLRAGQRRRALYGVKSM